MLVPFPPIATDRTLTPCMPPAMPLRRPAWMVCRYNHGQVHLGQRFNHDYTHHYHHRDDYDRHNDYHAAAPNSRQLPQAGTRRRARQLCGHGA